MTIQPHHRSTRSSLPMLLWRRVFLLVLLVFVGSVGHAWAMTTGTWGTAIERQIDPRHSELCAGADCHQDPSHLSECCGGGACACILDAHPTNVTPMAGLAMHFIKAQTLAGRLRESIYRPPRGVASQVTFP